MCRIEDGAQDKTIVKSSAPTPVDGASPMLEDSLTKKNPGLRLRLGPLLRYCPPIGSAPAGLSGMMWSSTGGCQTPAVPGHCNHQTCTSPRAALHSLVPRPQSRNSLA